MKVPTKEQILKDLELPEVVHKLDRLGRRRPNSYVVYDKLPTVSKKEKDIEKTKKF